MGVYQDFITHTTVMDKTEPQVAIDRVAYNELLRLKSELDPVARSVFATANESQNVAAFGGTYASGNYTLTLTLPDASTLTTANIAFDDNAATIEGAVNTVCTGNVSGWTNGDISVAGGALNSALVTLTFDGILAAKNMGTTVIADVDLVDGGVNSTNTITTNQGTIVLTADATGPAYDGENFLLNDSGTLGVTYNSGNTTFTIAYNGGTTNHVQVETAVNDAMTANPTWPQFECAVTNDALPVDAADDTLTVVTAGGVTSGSLGAVTTTVKGQPVRYAWAVMQELGLISASDLPDYGDALDGNVTLWSQASDNPRYPSAALRGVLSWQAAIDDANPTLRTQLKNLFRIQ